MFFLLSADNLPDTPKFVSETKMVIADSDSWNDLQLCHVHNHTSATFHSQAPPLRHRSLRVFLHDDRHVMAKHSAIYPSQEELENVQNMVSHTERALKAVSDWLDKQEKCDGDGADADKERRVFTDLIETKNRNSFCLYLRSSFSCCSEHKEQVTRTLRGVMRVGLVAKGLLLKGDLDLELVLLCREKPTNTLLKKVADNLDTQLKVGAEPNLLKQQKD